MQTMNLANQPSDAPAADGTITLSRKAVFQLLLFGLTERVRTEAARALDRIVKADPRRLECSNARVDALPCWERTAALLVAAMVERDTRALQAWGTPCKHATDFARKPPRYRSPAPCIFRYTTDSVRRTPWETPSVEDVAYRRIAFRLDPHLDIDQSRWTGRSWRTLSDARQPSCAQWLVREDGFRLSFSIHYGMFRGTDGWKSVRIRSPEGSVVGEFTPTDSGRSALHGWSLDPALVLRIESGALCGHVMERWFETPYARASRSRRCLVTVEIGASLADPPIAMLAFGEVTSGFAIDGPAGPLQFEFPLLGGATLASLDAIARRMGVYHGESLRGSFTHHPARHSKLAEVA
jgi:hypothetical protein